MSQYLTVQPGQRVCDTLGHRDPKVLKANGYVGIAVYYKATNARQIKIYTDAGLGVVMISEWKATYGDTGAAGGVAQGRSAAAWALKNGWPADVSMISANDQNTVVTNIENHVAHHRAFKAEYKNSTSLYADIDLMRALANDPIDVFWHPGTAWSWSGGRGIHHPLTHVVQGGDIHHIGVDDGIVLRPFKMWLGAGAAPPAVQVPKHDILKPGTVTPLGANVALLQTQCKARGWYPYKVDGWPGPKTGVAIKHLQASCGQKQDGWYGAKTEVAWATRLAAGI